MRKITFEERYFKNVGEWEYFLTELGVPEEEQSNISVIDVNIDGYEIVDYWEAP